MARYLITAGEPPRERRETQETAYWSLSWARALAAAPQEGRIEIFDEVAGERVSLAELTRRAQGELDELGIEEKL